ncbi:hypothetical protein SRABI96_02155 [Peribacillus sp. Bi96]|uniref:hypothetical protein n=1 Tax=unclassified Peribacillus TaxID=2675266 RepID=UPI001DAE1DF9|nr:hypothetical protein [Peribacillus sp. Bi96]CAH0210605.1 hypothetical protein SRABI96_02155 [Peribacillus sp. Bi96]
MRVPEEEHFLTSLPPHIGDKIDLFGSMITNIGNLLTILGIAAEAQEVEQVEVEEVSANSDTSASGSESNSGFILSLFGAILGALGDLISSSGTAIAIEETIILDKKAEQETQELNDKIKKMENQIALLQKDRNSLITVTEALKREVIFLQNVIYPNLYQK